MFVVTKVEDQEEESYQRVRDQIHFDRTDHFSSFFLTQKKCGLYDKNTRKGCSKSNVGIYDHCLTEWRDIQKIDNIWRINQIFIQ